MAAGVQDVLASPVPCWWGVLCTSRVGRRLLTPQWGCVPRPRARDVLGSVRMLLVALLSFWGAGAAVFITGTDEQMWVTHAWVL